MDAAVPGALAEQYPQVDPRAVRFTELRAWVLALPDFDDAPERCGERVLQALQQAWIDASDQSRVGCRMALGLAARRSWINGLRR